MPELIQYSLLFSSFPYCALPSHDGQISLSIKISFVGTVSQCRRLNTARGNCENSSVFCYQCSHFYKWLGRGGAPWVENSKQETDQTVLTTTKALSITTNCTCRAKKWGATKNSCAPTFKFFPAPLPSPRVSAIACLYSQTLQFNSLLTYLLTYLL